MANKHFMNCLVEDFPLEFVVKADLKTSKVNGKMRANFVANGKEIFTFKDKNGEKRWGIIPVKESTTEKVE